MTTHKVKQVGDQELLLRTIQHIRSSDLLSKEEKVRALRLRFDSHVFEACYEMAQEDSERGLGIGGVK